MLSRPHRLVTAEDYRATIRRGRRTMTTHTMVHVRANPDHSTVRFGFIVAKPVGIAVRRNLVRRRLKAASATLLASLPPGTDVVIRALPGAAQASWVSLSKEITEALGTIKEPSKGVARQ